MNIDIRKSITENFKDADSSEIKASIAEAINEKDEVTLPGIGVFFEILWNACSDDEKDFILKKLENEFKKSH